MGVFGDKLATTVDPKQLAVAFLGYLIFSLYMTIGAMETHKVLFAIFVLIDFLFVGLTLSTWGIMHDAMHNLAAYSELFISLLAFYASAASVLNTHFGRVVLPVESRSEFSRKQNRTTRMTPSCELLTHVTVPTNPFNRCSED